MSQAQQLEMRLDNQTSLAAASPVRTFPLPDIARAWLESEADYGLNFIVFYRSLSRLGLSSRTSPGFYPHKEGEILPSSFEGWSSAGMASVGGYLTLSISEWPSAAAVCSLSDILETGVPPKYSLSAKAARGILRRAEKRGKELPPLLQAALEQAAQGTNEQKRT